MDIELTTDYCQSNIRTIAEFFIKLQKIKMYLPNFWQLCDYNDIESVAKAISGAYLIEFCCWKWILETNRLSEWVMGCLQMPCYKTGGVLCPINKLFNKIKEGMCNIENEKEKEWKERNSIIEKRSQEIREGRPGSLKVH